MFGDGNEPVGATNGRPLALILNSFRRATNGRPYDRVYLKLTAKLQFITFFTPKIPFLKLYGSDNPHEAR